MAQQQRNNGSSKPSKRADTVVVRRLLQNNAEAGTQSTTRWGPGGEGLVCDRKLSALAQLNILFDKSR